VQTAHRSIHHQTRTSAGDQWFRRLSDADIPIPDTVEKRLGSRLRRRHGLTSFLAGDLGSDIQSPVLRKRRLLVVPGAWRALKPFVGPYFGYAYIRPPVIVD
jgi:hypothetical protein